MLAEDDIDDFENQEFTAEQDQPDEENPQNLIGFERTGHSVFELQDDLEQDLQLAADIDSCTAGLAFAREGSFLSVGLVAFTFCQNRQKVNVSVP